MQPTVLAQYHAAKDGVPVRLPDLGELVLRGGHTIAALIDDLARSVACWHYEEKGQQIGLVQNGQ